MKVKQLIKELKKMPQNVDVHVAMHDNAEYESAGYVYNVRHFVKEEYQDDVDDVAATDCCALDMFNDMPEECVILGC